MFDFPIVEKLDTSRSAKPNQPLPQKPRLSMVWAIDPETGRPAARWMAEKTDTPIALFAAAA